MKVYPQFLHDTHTRKKVLPKKATTWGWRDGSTARASALRKDLNPVPSPHIQGLTTAYSSSFRGIWCPLLASLGTCMQLYKHTVSEKKNRNFKESKVVHPPCSLAAV